MISGLTHFLVSFPMSLFAHSLISCLQYMHIVVTLGTGYVYIIVCFLFLILLPILPPTFFSLEFPVSHFLFIDIINHSSCLWLIIFTFIELIRSYAWNIFVLLMSLSTLSPLILSLLYPFLFERDPSPCLLLSTLYSSFVCNSAHIMFVVWINTCVKNVYFRS